MSASNKPLSVRAGKTLPEISKLKELWRTLSEDARDYWRSRLQSGGEGNTQPEIRRDIFAKLKINLRSDAQLSKFKSWMEQQDAMDAEAEQADEEERRILSEHPDWTKQQVREDLLRRFYNRARATGDSKLGLKTVAGDMKTEALAFEKEKFQESKKSQAEKALELCLEEARKYPEVQQLFKDAFAALKKAQKK